MNTATKYQTEDVYGINRTLPLNYVTRDTVDNVFSSSLTRKKHLIIYGSSKQGKTSLRKRWLKDNEHIIVHCSNKWSIAELHSAILKRAGYEVEQSTTKTTAGKNKIVAALKANLFGVGVEAGGDQEITNTASTTSRRLELDPEDANDIIEALANFKHIIVLEDFHYLTIETQKDFAVALKAFHEQSDLCFVIVGVWLEEGRLTVYNGDLTGRIVGINADKWTKEELRKVINSGESLLNISFSKNFKNALLSECLDNVYIVQEACYRACIEQKIETNQDKIINEVGYNIDVKALLKTIVNQQTGRYNSFITNFANGFQETSLQMYKWLLHPVITSNTTDLESGLSYRTIKNDLQQHHPEGEKLNLGNLTQALQSVASLQVKKDIKPIVLDYDQTNLKLNVVDRGFLIWKDNQNQQELLDQASLPTS